MICGMVVVFSEKPWKINLMAYKLNQNDEPGGQVSIVRVRKSITSRLGSRYVPANGDRSILRPPFGPPPFPDCF